MREAGLTMNDRVALARATRKKHDVWPGDRPDFDGSVRYEDAAPEYVGHRLRRLEVKARAWRERNEGPIIITFDKEGRGIY